MYRTTGYPIDLALRDSLRAGRARRFGRLGSLAARLRPRGAGRDVVTAAQPDRNTAAGADVLAWHPRVPTSGSGVRDTPPGAQAEPPRDRLDRSWG
jgi:hypothetical protein